MSSLNDTYKNNGYFSMNSEKLSNISDATFNKNYLTARSPERARSCSLALLSENSTITNKLTNKSEKQVKTSKN